MNRLLTLAYATIWFALTAFSGPGRNEGTLTFRTTQGEEVFKTTTLPYFLNQEENRVKFYFKSGYFQSGNPSRDAKLLTITNAESYPIIEFEGVLAKGVNTIGKGKTLKTVAVGYGKFSGITKKMSVPCTLTKSGKAIICTASLALDWQSIPSLKDKGTQLGIQGPVLITLTNTF